MEHGLSKDCGDPDWQRHQRCGSEGRQGERPHLRRFHRGGERSADERDALFPRALLWQTGGERQEHQEGRQTVCRGRTGSERI